MTSQNKSPDDNPLKSSDSLLTREVFYAGDLIMEQGAPGNRAYYIEKGSADVIVKEGERSTKVAVLNQGDIFGEMALIVNAPRSATVKAKEDCTVTVISRPDMEKRLESYDDPVLKALLETLIQRLQDSNIRQAEYSNELNMYQKKMIGLFEKMPFGLSVDQQEQFKKDIVPVLEDLDRVLEKYKGSFLKKAEQKGINT